MIVLMTVMIVILLPIRQGKTTWAWFTFNSWGNNPDLTHFTAYHEPVDCIFHIRVGGAAGGRPFHYKQ